MTVRTVPYSFKFPPGRYPPAPYLLIGAESGSVDFAKGLTLKGSVADPGCLSPDPDFYPSRIPDPRTAPKEEGEKILYLKRKIIF